MECNEIILTEKQLLAIPVIVAAKNNAAAADILDITPKTIFEWLKQPHFKAAVDIARKQVVEDAVNRLKGLALKAVDTLGSLMDRVDCPAIQRNAANDLLHHLSKFTEMEEIDRRLREIEAKIK